MFDITQLHQTNQQKHRQQADEAAAKDTLFALFQQHQLTLTELLQYLQQAEQQGLLNGFRLGDFLASSTTITHQQNGAKKISSKERKDAIRIILGVLSQHDKAMTKAEVIAEVGSEVIQSAWSSLVRTMRTQELIEDGGGERNSKRYNITDKGRTWNR